MLDDMALPPGKTCGDCGNAECGWRGELAECSMLGAIGPLCPLCREIVEPDAPPPVTQGTQAAPAASEQWMTVQVVGLVQLVEALSRADRKGYLPDAMAEQWDAFNYRTPPAPPEPKVDVVNWLDDGMPFEVRVAGPDDLIPFGDELAAHRCANATNKAYLADRLAHPDSEVLCVATVHQRQCANPSPIPIEAALRELVALKDLRDRIEAPTLDAAVQPWPSLDARLAARADYDRRKPFAWAAARAALGSGESGGTTT